MLEALEAHWPERSFDATWWAEAPALPDHRLVLAPAGPWGEQLLCRIAAALGHLGSLRLGSRVRREAGALLLDWACDALPDGGADLLVVAAEAFLAARAALSLIHPKSAVLVVSAAEDSDELARAISAEARAAIREMDLHMSWVTDPRYRVVIAWLRSTAGHTANSAKAHQICGSSGAMRGRSTTAGVVDQVCCPENAGR